MALIKSSLTCGGYLFKFDENELIALIASKDVPNALSFAESLIKFFLLPSQNLVYRNLIFQ